MKIASIVRGHAVRQTRAGIAAYLRAVGEPAPNGLAIDAIAMIAAFLPGLLCLSIISLTDDYEFRVPLIWINVTGLEWSKLSLLPQWEFVMEISFRDLMTVLHGMGFGALFMLAFSGALAEIFRMSAPGAPSQPSEREQNLLNLYLGAMVILAWAAVLSGAYVVYPWYRAVPPEGTIDLTEFPKFLLTSSPRTSAWHSLGMEWKEHVAWLAPIAMTMVAYVFAKYARVITNHRELRTAVLGFAVVAFVATGVAGGFGAFLNKYAPVRGGATIQIISGEEGEGE